MANARIYSVGQVNNYIKNIISQDYVLKNLTIKGEVSNCKYHSLGHIYFSLKDETGTIPCVMFKTSRAGLDFTLEEGQMVLVTGGVSVYERDGRYQLYAKSIKLDGMGDLHIRFEQLKQKLFEEGLFDFEKKKPIPKYPKTVGIVTASTGAAIQDIKNIAKRRNPYVQLILYPAKVQGEGAAETIVQGIKTLDAMGVDTIIVGRGGGSIEDLWAFNEEMVARAIYEAHTPIISGTGHEVDTTLADYAADKRAPTPSAAAELAIPDVMESVNTLRRLEGSLVNLMSGKLRLTVAQLDILEQRLTSLSPAQKLSEQTQYLSELYDRMRHAIENRYKDSLHRYDTLAAGLHGLSPMTRLVGGFGYIDRDDTPVRSVKDIKEGSTINVTLHDGKLKAVVQEVKAHYGE